MKNESQKHIKHYIQKPDNLISTVIGAILSLLILLFRSIKIELWITGIITVVLLFVIWILLIMLFNEKNRVMQNNTIALEINQIQQISGKEIIILNKNDILKLDVMIDIFYFNNDIEQLIAIGKLINIQQNQLQQIQILCWYINNEIKNELLHNNLKYIKNIIVRPKFQTSGGYEHDEYKNN